MQSAGAAAVDRNRRWKMCNNYDPDGNLDTMTGSCAHKCACGMNTYYGCWYDECVNYATCPSFDSHYWDEKKAENKARNAEILVQRGIIES